MNASLFVLSMASLTAGPQQDVLYDFYGPSCGYCQMMMPTVDRLASEGLPVVKVNVEENPRLAQRFGVQVLPTLVLVVGGAEQQRLTGYQDESSLRALLARIPKRQPRESRGDGAFQAPRAGRPLPVHIADEESKPKWDLGFHLPLPSFPGRKEKIVQIEPASQSGGSRARSMSVVSNTKADPSNASSARDAAPPDERAADGAADTDAQRASTSCVRIRVTDAGGVDMSSGVIIDSAAGRSVVLTCGHALRDAKSDSQVEVDVFTNRGARTFPGTIVKFDLNADVGLVTIRTPAALPASPVASIGEAVARGDAVYSIGCSGGKAPSLERMRVTALNRYQGPDTIECTGAPLQGRSGGGLFTAQGRVVGVCTNADPKERRGIYAGLKPIHALLHGAGLDELIPARGGSAGDALADADAPPADSPPRKTPPAEDPGVDRRELETAQLTPPRERRSAARDQVDPPGGAGLSLSKDEQTATRGAEDAEVICIIRPINQPDAASRVVIINRASRKFMAYLKGESQDHLLPTAQFVPAETDHENLPDSPKPEPQQRKQLRSQITAAWKPAGSAPPAEAPRRQQWVRTVRRSVAAPAQ